MIRKPILILLVFLLSVSCKKDELNKNTNWTYQLSKVKHSFIATNKELVLKYHKELDEFVRDINWFSTIPSTGNLQVAKNKWIQSFNQYNLIQPLLFFDKNGLNKFNFDFERVDLSNLDPSYIDYTVANPNGGIIMDTVTYPNITFQDIPNWDLHHITGNESKITLGYHVIEFLLWGEDLSVTGTGARTNNDYLSNNSINNRRRVFLTSVGSYLELDNEALNFNANYENSILLMESEKFMTAMFLGITNFIDNDFANRTLLKPYNSQNIEDELSRFSDNTKPDIYSKLMAIKHFLDGREVLQEHNDYFFGDFLNEIDSDKYQQIKNKLDECFSIYNSINGSFDNSINISSPERTKVYALYTAVTSISNSLKEIQSKILN